MGSNLQNHTQNERVFRVLKAFTSNIEVIFSTRFECSFLSSPPISSVFFIFYTHFEFVFVSSPLISSVLLYLLHSFRVCFCIFSTRFECSLWLIGSIGSGHAVKAVNNSLLAANILLGKTTLETSGEDL
jgi:hypothetical protein